MPSTSLYARRTAALGPIVALILIAWLVGLPSIAAFDPLNCGEAGSILSRCTPLEVSNSENLMFVYWALATSGPMLALGVWTFLSPESRRFRAAYAVVAVWLFVAAPWMMNIAAGLLTGDALLAELPADLPVDFAPIRTWLIAGVVGRLILVVSAPLALSVIVLRRGHWIYASAWFAVTVTAAATIKAVLF
ncbi:hypothetical protein [Glycomyces sp. NPDC048151]|uniref:hypothetical protein n=1 Tax=Glycomyces sp. NPDC048151 TaxID=3364002 RepID=UPI0037232228